MIDMQLSNKHHLNSEEKIKIEENMNIKLEQKPNLINAQATFDLILGGSTDIDAKTLLAVLDNTLQIFYNITEQFEPNAELNLTIKSTNPGSFTLKLATIIKHTPSLMYAAAQTEGGITNVANKCIDSFKKLLEIKNALKGKPVTNIEKDNGRTTLLNENGDNYDFDNRNQQLENLIKDNNINNSLILICQNLNGDPFRGALELKDENGKSVTLSKEVIDKISTTPPQVSDENTVIVREVTSANVFVKKPDFHGKSKWELLLHGNPIRADIKDQEWLDKVHNGEVTGFGAKITLPVEIEIQYDLDGKNNLVPNSHRYSVLKVTGDIIPPAINMDLFDKQDKSKHHE